MRRRQTLVAILGVALSGCEPEPGRKIDSAVIERGKLSFKVQTFAEGSIGNPAKGHHWQILCKSPNTLARKQQVDGWIAVADGYDVRRFESAPVDQVTIVSEEIAYSTLGAFVTFDGCATLGQWYSQMLPKVIEDELPIGPKYDLIKAIDILGPQEVELTLDPVRFRNGALVKVKSYDGGKHWQISTYLPEYTYEKRDKTTPEQQ